MSHPSLAFVAVLGIALHAPSTAPGRQAVVPVAAPWHGIPQDRSLAAPRHLDRACGGIRIDDWLPTLVRTRGEAPAGGQPCAC